MSDRCYRAGVNKFEACGERRHILGGDAAYGSWRDLDRALAAALSEIARTNFQVMNNEAVLYNVEGAVALVTLNRPEKRNALNDALIGGLETALRAARKDEGGGGPF